MSDFIAWASHGSRHGHPEHDGRKSLKLTILAVGVVLVLVIYLVLTSVTAAQGRKIQDLQGEIFSLQQENAQIEVDIAREVSIPRLMTRVHEKGYVPAEAVDFLDLSGK
ncbi:MAG: hypothetical protein GX620_09960 [Chloroflexi bacterium]|nr:hypothetical protein [Chloroflexota bacterium]